LRARALVHLRALFPFSFPAGAATGQSNFGWLPAVYPSPVHACPHDLGGLKLLAKAVKDKAGAIIGVSHVVVNCPRCKGAPYLVGKHQGKMQTKTRAITLAKELPAARALFAEHGVSLFKGQGAVEPMADDDE
jgi:hypothetical protein